MAAEDRAWPVVLDPAVVADLTDNNIADAIVIQKRPTEHNSTLGTLQIGYSENSKITRSYLKFIDLPSLSSANVIINAQFSLKKIGSVTTPVPATIHKVTQSWNVSGLCWNNKPAFDTTIADYTVIKGAARYYWDITDIVQSWYASANNGLMVKASDTIEQNADTNYWKEFYSSDYGGTSTNPWLIITYRNSTGLESYWDYTSSNAGRAGTGYVNNFTGNLVWVHDDIGFGGNLMPVSIRHIYNASDNTISRFGVGNGWRTNFSQRVLQWSGDSNYYIWVDEDGTRHYFLKESTGIYKDEDGLKLTLTTNGSGKRTYRITDEDQTLSYYFDTEGRLAFIENNQEEKSNIAITYTATTGYRISTITDGAGRKYKFTYSNNLLNKITYTGKGTEEISSISYGYTGNNLTSIQYKDGKSVAFSYNAKNLLTMARDVDGYELRYEYNTTADSKPSRISQVSEHQGDKNAGSLTFAYAHNQTTITDHNLNAQILQFNDLGNTVSVQDGEGHAQYAKYATADTDHNEKANQMLASSKLQNTVSNLLSNTSFESGMTWTAAANVAEVASGGYLGSKALKVTGGRANSERFVLGSGEVCTFSAYVNAETTGASLAIFTHSNENDSGSVQTTQSIPITNGWSRVEVHYTNSTANNQTLSAALQCGTGQTVYMDCVQVEKMPTASRYNLIQNGDFSVAGSPAAGWTGAGIGTADIRTTVSSGAAPQLDTNVMQLNGTLTTKKSISQTIPISGTDKDTYVVAGWALADSVPIYTDNEAREFGIRVVFKNGSTEVSSATAQFNSDANSTVNWQYSAAAAVPTGEYDSIVVEVIYDYNANTAYFDGIQLYKENFGQSYTYEDGNLVSVKDLQEETTTYEYEGNLLTEEMLPNGSKVTYTYDDWKNVETATTTTGLTYAFTYDDYGNNTSVSITENGVTLSATATYTGDKNRLASTTDANGETTTYEYDENTNQLNWVQYPNDEGTTKKTTYTYDNMFRMASAVAQITESKQLSAQYTYEDDQLKTLATPSTTYTFNYGDFGLRTNVMVGNTELAQYRYTDQNYYLSSLDYGNGDKVQYTYDDQGRVTKQTYEDGATVTYRYDNDGALATVTDDVTDRTTTYYYDFIDRMMKYVENGSGYNHSVGYEYDQINNLTKLVETINGAKYTTGYTYDKDNRVTSIAGGLHTTNTEGVAAIGNATIKDYVYDNFGRVSTQTTSKYNGNYVAPQPQEDSTESTQPAPDPNKATVKTDTFQFTAPAIPAGETDTTPRTSSQVASHSIVTNANDPTKYNKTFTYTYDDNGNIESISDGERTVFYTYDSANQLIGEYNGFTETVTVWGYDSAGNITNWRKLEYINGSLGSVLGNGSYTYKTGENDWRDLLIKYNNEDINYDDIGNPLTWGNRTYTWKHGRQLATLSENGTAWTFTYNADGIRTKRTNGSTTYNYVYNGDKLSQMTKGNDTLNFFYDASGTPMTVQYNGTTYYYVTNIQGDVIAILNGSGAAEVEYLYNAWGELVSTTGSMATTLGVTNPLRYRGYVFDSEYEFYYLSTRYYDPQVGRFLNADEYPSTGQGVLGNNMFAYCNNNPIIRIDESGEFFNTICGAVIGGAIAALTCGEGETPAQAFMRGAVTGAIAGVGLDLCIATGGIGGLIVVGITGAASGVIDTVWEKKNQGNDINWGEAVANGIIGAGLNVLFGAAGREAKNAVGKTLKEVGKAVVKNFNRSIRSNAGKVVAKKAVQATATNLSYSAVQGAAAKVYSLITAKMLKEAW